MKFRALLSSTVATCVLLTAPVAHAATYYWKGSTGGALWSDLSSWSTESATGADAESLPTASDNITTSSALVADLGGQVREINGWSGSRGGTLENGTLVAHGAVTPGISAPTYTVKSGTTLRFAAGSRWNLSDQSRSGMSIVNLESGSTLDFNGGIHIYRAQINVASGATARFNWTRFGANDGTNMKDSGLFNGGTVELPNGMVWASGGYSANYYDFTLRNDPGATLVVGGNFSKGQADGSGVNRHVVFKVDIAGGTFHATNSVSFDADSLAVTGSSEWIVDAGRTVDLSPFALSPGITLTKSGGGRLVLPAFPSSLVFQGGSVAVPATENTTGTLVIESGASFETPCEQLTVSDLSLRGNLAITKPGLVVSTGGGSGTVTVDLAVFHEGDLVASTANATLRAKVKAAAEAAAAGTDFEIEESGNEIRVAVNSGTYVFNSTTVSDMSDPAGWLGGAVPPAGADILVSGAGVVAELTAACPVWDSIEALGGTTLRLARAPGSTELRFEPTAALVVEEGVSLALAGTLGTENVRLEAGAALSVVPGATVALGAGFAGTASATNLPTVSVPADATLQVPGGFGFKNVALSASGTIEAVSAGNLTFGAASAGETAWLSLSLDGATVSALDGDIDFACSASGGTVKTVGTWTVKDSTFSHASSRGFDFGVGNPASEPIPIVFDGTAVDYGDGTHYIAGGVTATFRNGARLYRNNRHSLSYLYVEGRSALVFEPGTAFKYGHSNGSGGSVGNGSCSFRPDESGHVSLVLEDATWEIYHPDGNGKAVAEIGGTSARTVRYNGYNRKDPFTGFKEIVLRDGAALDLSIGPLDKDGGSADTLNSGLVLLQQPNGTAFAGGGSFAFSNGLPSKVRSYVVTSSANSSTGTLSAAAASNAKVVLGTGANWAGTVVWDGGVELTVVDDTTPFSYALGGLRLDAPFPFRLWENGVCDTIDLVREGWTGASGIVFHPAGGLVPEAGDEWILGTMPAGTAPPISANARWVLSTRAVEGNEDVVQLVVTAASASFVFFSDETADLNDPDGWLCGYVPTDQDVVIAGAGVAPAVTAATPLPSFASIVVRDGASLAVRDSCALPDVQMSPGTSLEISGSGTEATLASFSALAPTPGGAPAAVVRVGDGATLAPAADASFRNARMTLLAGATLAGAGNLTLGWAGVGETAVFGLAATNATISTAGNGSLGLACPAAGGRVVALGPLSLSGCTLDTRLGWVRFCENNPTNEPVEFVLDRTDLAAKGVSDNPACGVLVAGAALVRMENGSAMYRDTPANPQYGAYRPTFKQRGRMVFSGTHAALPAEIRAPFCSDSKAQACFAPDEDGWPSLELRGTRAWLWMNKLVGSDSNGRAVLKVADASLVCGMVYWWGFRPYFLNGLKAVEIEEGTTLEIVRRPLGSPWSFGDTAVGNTAVTDDAAGQQTFILAKVPFTGGGSLVITNAREKLFHVLLQSGENTATGTLSVHDAVPGGTNAWLLVNDGANWAGTVVADGNVRLVHAEDGNTENGKFYFEDTGESAAVSFGGLDCRKDLAVRVWGRGIRIYAPGGSRNDRISFGETGFLGHGGLLAVEPQEGCNPSTGDKWYLGTIQAGAPEPSVKGRWRVVRKPSAVPGVDDEWLVYGKMTLVILR